MLETFIELAEYVWDFYSPNSDLYPIKGLTMEDVYAAIYEYKQRLLKVSYNNPEYIKAFGNNYTWGYGDSLDLSLIHISEPTRLLSIAYSVLLV